MPFDNMTTSWDVSYLGSGSYSSVLRVDIKREGHVFSCAVAVSLVDADIYGDRLGDFNDDCKSFADVIPEITGGLLVTSLRVPGFLAYHRAFVVGGVTFQEYMRDTSMRSTVLGKMCAALAQRSNKRRDIYMNVPIENSHVMFVFMGLADGGELFDGLDNDPFATDTIRQWSFTLLWSLLAAQRVFNFEHRDIKSGNIVLHKEGAGASHFYLDAPDVPKMHFAVTRGHTGRSAMVPKFVDLNFCAYVFTTLDPKVATLQGLGESFHDTDNPDVDANVNESARWLATCPSPDMLFMTDDAQRDFDSDVFSLGLVVFEMCCRQSSFLYRLEMEAVEDQFLNLWHKEIKKRPVVSIRPQREAEKGTLKSRNSATVLRYMWLMQALGHGFWPSASSPLATSALYKFLRRPALQAFLDDLMPPRLLVDELQWIERTHGAPVMDFLRSCLTWDKSTRGVFKGGPPARPATPASFRLIMHDFFSPLRSTDTNVRAEDTHILHYKDPPRFESLDDISSKARWRIFDRIHTIEAAAVAQIETVLNGDMFAEAIFDFADTVMDAFETPTTLDMTTKQKRPAVVADATDDNGAIVSPIAKRARVRDVNSSFTQESAERGRLYAPEEDLMNI